MTISHACQREWCDAGDEHLFVFESGEGLQIPIESEADESESGRWMPPFFPGSLAVNQRGDLTALGAAPATNGAKLRTIIFDW